MTGPHRMAVALGDAGGIWLELAARVLSDPEVRFDLTVFGDAHALALGARQAGVDAVMSTPFDKATMRMANGDYVDEIGFVTAVLETDRAGREFDVLDEVWNAQVTSHIPPSRRSQAARPSSASSTVSRRRSR